MIQGATRRTSGVQWPEFPRLPDSIRSTEDGKRYDDDVQRMWFDFRAQLDRLTVGSRIATINNGRGSGSGGFGTSATAETVDDAVKRVSKLEARMGDAEASITRIDEVVVTPDSALARITTELLARIGGTSEANIKEILSAYATRTFAEAKKTEAISAAYGQSVASFNSTLVAYATKAYAETKKQEAITVSYGEASAMVSVEAAARATKDGYMHGHYLLNVQAGNKVAGMKLTADSDPTGWTTKSSIEFVADVFKISFDTAEGDAIAPFTVEEIDGTPTVRINGELLVDLGLTTPIITGGKLRLQGDSVVCSTTTDGADTSIVRINGGGAANSITRDRGGQIDLLGNEYSTVPGYAGSILLTPGDTEDGTVRARDRSGFDRIVVDPDGKIWLKGNVAVEGELNGAAIGQSSLVLDPDPDADNSTAIQDAIDAAGDAGGGTVVLPPGEFLTGTLFINDPGVILTSNGGTILKSLTNQQVVLAIRASNSGVERVGFDGKWTNEQKAGDYGLVQVISNGSLVSGAFVTDCKIRNSRSCGILLRGDVEDTKIGLNDIASTFVGINSNTTDEGIPLRTRVFNNKISSVISGQSTYVGSGGLKFSRNGVINLAEGSGHLITGNVVRTTGEMGIEIWGYSSHDTTVSDNGVSDCTFGISVNNARRCVVANNRVRSCTYTMIELADYVTDTVVSGNDLCNYDDSGTRQGCSGGVIACNWGSDPLQNQNNIICGNWISGTPDRAIHLNGSSSVSVIGNVIRDCGATVGAKSCQRITIKGNTFDRITNGGIFIDIDGTDMEDLEISFNTFLGTNANNYDPIVIYDNGTGNTLTNLTITGNTLLSRFKYYTLNNQIPVARQVNWSIVRNISSNLGGDYCSLPDYTSPDVTGPQYVTISKNTRSFNLAFSDTGFTVNVPDDNVNSRWFKIWSNGFGVQASVNLAISYDALNVRQDMLFQVYTGRYGSGSSILKFPSAYFNGRFIEEVVVWNSNNYDTSEIWVKVAPSDAFSFTFWLSAFTNSAIDDPTGTTTEPTWSGGGQRASWILQLADEMMTGFGFHANGVLSSASNDYPLTWEPKARLWIRGPVEYGPYRNIARFETEAGTMAMETREGGETVVSNLLTGEPNDHNLGLTMGKPFSVSLTEDLVNSRWVKIWSADQGIQQLFHIGFSFDADNARQDVLFQIYAGRYGSASTITKFPHTYFNWRFLQELVVNNVGGGSVVEIWVKVSPGIAQTFKFWVSGFSDYALDNGTQQTATPSFYATAAKWKMHVSDHDFTADLFSSWYGFYSAPYASALSGDPKARLWIRGPQGWGGEPGRIARFEKTDGTVLFESRESDGKNFVKNLDFGTEVSGQEILLYHDGNKKYGFGIQDSELRTFMHAGSPRKMTWGTMSEDGSDTFTELMKLDYAGNLNVDGTVTAAAFNATP